MAIAHIADKGAPPTADVLFCKFLMVSCVVVCSLWRVSSTSSCNSDILSISLRVVLLKSVSYLHNIMYHLAVTFVF